MDDSSDQVERIPLDYDNIQMIVDLIKANLLALPEHYVQGFESYLAEISAPSRVQNDAANQFWQHLIVTYAKYNAYQLEAIHNFWVESCVEDGWNYSNEFDLTLKVCPLLIKFEELNLEESSLIRLFAGVIWAMVVQDDDE